MSEISEPVCSNQWVALWAPVLTVAAAYVFLSFGPLAVIRQRADGKVPEAGFGYSERKLTEFLSAAGPDGDLMYRRALRYDMWFSVLYGIGWTLALATSFSRVVGDEYRMLRWLTLTPVLLAVVDLIEDSLLLGIVDAQPGCHDGLLRPDLVPVASAVTIAKWLLFALAAGVTVYGYVMLARHGYVT